MTFIEREVAIPMRDGIVLRAEVWRPSGDGRAPTLLVRTPYLKEQAAPSALVDPRLATARGYVVVLQDVRGRGTSEGIFSPFVNERADGFDTVAWIREQSWSDGNVVMGGMSYYGATQWLAADSGAHGLVGIAPALTSPVIGEGWSFTNGVREWGFLTCWNATDLAEPQDCWYDEPERAFLDVEGLAKITPWVRDWVSEGSESPYWSTLGVADLSAPRSVPALIAAGWYDIFCSASIRSFMRNHPDDRLVIGPWGHDKLLNHLVGDANFGMAGNGAAWSFAAKSLDFFDAVMSGRPSALQRVSVYVLGLRQWLGFDAWPPSEAQPWELPLAPASFDVDPTEPPPSLGGRGLLVLMPGSGYGVRDQRPLQNRTDVATVLDVEVHEVTLLLGAVTAHLKVEASGGGMRQWVATLCIARSDGSLMNLTEGVANAPVEADEVTVPLGDIGVQLAPGERLVLLVSGASWPRWELPDSPGIQKIQAGSSLLFSRLKHTNTFGAVS